MHTSHTALTTKGEIRSPKNRVVAVLFCVFLGYLGAHRFYVGKFWTGLLQLFTGGAFGVWVIIDFILLLMGRFKDGEGRILGPPQRQMLPSAAPQATSAPAAQTPPQKDDDLDDDLLLADPLEEEFAKLEAEQRARQ